MQCLQYYCSLRFEYWLVKLLNKVAHYIRYAAFQGYCRELKKRKKQKTFIVKPANGAMGNG